MSETRDIGFLKWSDPLAWMEPMKGERWKTTLRSEERRFEKACNDLAISSETEKIIKKSEREKISSENFCNFFLYNDSKLLTINKNFKFWSNSAIYL